MESSKGIDTIPSAFCACTWSGVTRAVYWAGIKDVSSLTRSCLFFCLLLFWGRCNRRCSGLMVFTSLSQEEDLNHRTTKRTSLTHRYARLHIGPSSPILSFLHFTTGDDYFHERGSLEWRVWSNLFTINELSLHSICVCGATVVIISFGLTFCKHSGGKRGMGRLYQRSGHS